MPRKPSQREQQVRMDGLVLEVEALAKKFGCPFSDIAYYLLYQTEVATGCEMHHETRNDTDPVVQEKMSEVLDESHDAAIDDGGNFVSDHFDQIEKVGKRWDPEFRRKLPNRSDYAKHTEPYDPKKHGSFAEWSGPGGQKKITAALREKFDGKA